MAPERDTPTTGPTTADDEPPSPIAATVARVVRARRTDRGMTLADLAGQSGVSRRMIALIESGRTNPSLGTVERIGRALGLEFAEMIGARTEGDSATAHPAVMVTPWRSPSGGYGRIAVTGSGVHRTELWDWLLMPGDSYLDEADPDGTQELILVVDGVLTVRFEAEAGHGGEADRVLAAGEAVRLPSDRPFSYVNEGATPVRFARNTLPAPLP